HLRINGKTRGALRRPARCRCLELVTHAKSDRPRAPRHDQRSRAAAASGEAAELIALVEDVRAEQLDAVPGPIETGEQVDECRRDELASNASAVSRGVEAVRGNVPLDLRIGIGGRRIERQSAAHIIDIGLNAVDPGIPAVVDLGKAVLAEEGELELPPQLTVD